MVGTETVEYRLKRFRPDKMQTNRCVIMIGRKGTGKSTLIKDLLWFHQNIPCGVIMSGTEEANQAFSSLVPPLYIYKGFDADALENIVNRQKKYKAMFKENGDYLPFDHRAFCVIDDCMYDKKSFATEQMRELFMNGRHWDLFVLLSVQYCMDLSPPIRQNTDYLIACRDPNEESRKKLHKYFFGVGIPSFRVFDTLFQEVTQEYRCLVLDNTKTSNKVEDCVYWYKAQERPKFQVGADWFREFAKKRTKNTGSAAMLPEDKKKLEEMNKKAVRVVLEGQQQQQQQQRQQPPPPPQQWQPISYSYPQSNNNNSYQYPQSNNHQSNNNNTYQHPQLRPINHHHQYNGQQNYDYNSGQLYQQSVQQREKLYNTQLVNINNMKNLNMFSGYSDIKPMRAAMSSSNSRQRENEYGGFVI